MDHEYLQNVMGSPYVQEGAFSRLKAKGAQAMGAIGAMAGHQIQSPVETQLRSLWEGFVSSLKKLMKDWEGQVSPMFDQKVPLTNEKQQQVKEALDALAQTLSSMGPQKVGNFPQGEHDPRVRNQRDNPETYVKGSAYNRSTTSPTKLTELMAEGFWDAANRDMGLNKALGSNDPSTILDKYKNQVLSIFQNFMKDAVKMTRMTAQQIYAVLAKMQPAKGGWQAAGNMQKVVGQLKTLQSIGDIKGTGAPPVINPPADATQPEAQPEPEPEAQPEQPAQQQPTPQPAPQAQPQPTAQQTPPPAQGAGIAGGSGSTSADELPFIVLKAMKIIIDAVKNDKQHVGTFFSGGELPKDYGGNTLYGKVSPTVTETTSGPKPKGGAAGEDNFPEPPEKEVPNQFLYNFHSKHRKTPASSFSIQVKPVTEPEVVEELPSKPTVEVWWQNEGHKNRIFAVATTQGKKSKPVPIMQFFDNEVSSKAGSTTPTDPNFFTADKVLQASNPNGDSPIAKASEQVKAEIKQLEPDLLRALMATTGRKAMEFVPKSTKIFRMKYDEAGDVTTKDGTYDKEEVKANLASPNPKVAEAWSETLDAYGYFESFPDMKPGAAASASPASASGLPQAYEDGVKALTQIMKAKGVKPEQVQKQAEQMAQQAWVKLKGQGKTDITAEDVLQMALSGKPNTPSKPEAPEAPAAPEAPSGADVSKPAGEPPAAKEPTAPVSGGASGPPPTTNPTAPVSGEKPEPDKGQGQEPQQPQQPTAQPDAGAQNKFGAVKIRRKQIEWEHPKTHEVHLVSADQLEKFAKKQPKFANALKSHPELYQKFKDMIEKDQKKPEGGGDEKPQVAERAGYINPFNRDNLL